jgi:hypothetical protein
MSAAAEGRPEGRVAARLTSADTRRMRNADSYKEAERAFARIFP